MSLQIPPMALLVLMALFMTAVAGWLLTTVPALKYKRCCLDSEALSNFSRTNVGVVQQGLRSKEETTTIVAPPYEGVLYMDLIHEQSLATRADKLEDTMQELDQEYDVRHQGSQSAGNRAIRKVQIAIKTTNDQVKELKQKSNNALLETEAQLKALQAKVDADIEEAQTRAAGRMHSECKKLANPTTASQAQT